MPPYKVIGTSVYAFSYETSGRKWLESDIIRFFILNVVLLFIRMWCMHTAYSLHEQKKLWKKMWWRNYSHSSQLAQISCQKDRRWSLLSGTLRVEWPFYKNWTCASSKVVLALISCSVLVQNNLRNESKPLKIILRYQNSYVSSNSVNYFVSHARLSTSLKQYDTIQLGNTL